MTTIGYAKFGRSMGFDPGKYGFQGDAEAPNLLIRLAERNPDVTWVLTGKHGAITIPLPENVIDPWPADLPRSFWTQVDGDVVCSFCKTVLPNVPNLRPNCCEKTAKIVAAEDFVVNMELDGMVMHIGQHGTSNDPLPEVKNRSKLTLPQAWARNYGGYLAKAANNVSRRGKPISWLCTDPRNYMKARDFAYVNGLDRILAQYQFTRKQGHETGERIEMHEHRYRHAGLELMMLPNDWTTWGGATFDEREPLGVATTAFWHAKPECRRSWVTQQYVLSQFPDAKIYGKWDDKSLAEVDRSRIIRNNPKDFIDLMSSWRTTIALPPFSRHKEGIGWTTAKPYQAMACNTVVFFIRELDAQGWILPSIMKTAGTHQVSDGLYSVRDDWTEDDFHLARWLRPRTPDDFKRRADIASTDRDTWNWLVSQQRSLLQRHWDLHFVERCIEHQLGI